MQFHHMDYPPDTPVDELGPAALDTLLEDGDLQTWGSLAATVRKDPYGGTANTILMLCEAHPMYGTSALWRSWIERLRAQHAASPERLTLAELRRRHGLTQEEVGARLGISQSDVSKLEHRRDMRLGTLIAYIRALNAHLELVAHRPDGSVAAIEI